MEIMEALGRELNLSHLTGTRCIGGRLRSTGEEVAVKVQRPGIGENIAIDMVLLRRLMTAFDAALPRLRLPIQARGMPFPSVNF